MVRSRQKLWLLPLLLAMMVAVLAPFTAQAQDVTYLDASGTQQTLADGTYTVVTDQTEWTSGWYVVNANVTIGSRITATGDVHLVLMDGFKLTASKGITVNYDATSNNALTIYAQSDGTGMGGLLVNSVDDNLAGIGGGDYQDCGVITINGGDLDIKCGENGANIGSGRHPYNNSTINNGVVTINGGKLNLRSNSMGNAAAIGGGEYTSGGTITINGGNITANGSTYGAGIGGCDGYGGGVITINGGTITAKGMSGSPGIGGGAYWSTGNLNSGNSGTITINGGNITSYSNSKNGMISAAIGAAIAAKTPGDGDVIRLNWTNESDRYETIGDGKGYSSGKILFIKPLNIESTGERATLADLEQASVLVPHDGETLHSVTYMLDGEVYEQYNVVEGECAQDFKLRHDDRVFDAWYEDGASEPWNFELPVMQDLVLVGQFHDLEISTDESGTYLIGSLVDWNVFCVLLKNGLINTSSNAKLTADITDPVDYYVVGDRDHIFTGTFDGQGHTLTLDLMANRTYYSPFYYVNSYATIKDLVVEGTITTNAMYVGGLVGYSYGVTINNCVVSASIVANVSGTAYLGGLVGYSYSNTQIKNCIFDGKLLGSNASTSCGFIGWGIIDGYSISNSYFIPEEITISSYNSKTFTYENTPNLSNCYYTTPFGTEQGVQMMAVTAGEGVTILSAPLLSHKGVNYFTNGMTIELSYDLPEGKYFNTYTISNGEITNATTMTGEHVISGLTGAATITGSYMDSKTDISTAEVAEIDDVTYNKEPQKPELHVTLGDAVLVNGEDYIVEWSNNVDAGLATATILGIGQYGGELTANFNILPRDINDEVIDAKCRKMFARTGASIYPSPVIMYGDYKLISGTDYVLTSCEGFIEPGDYSRTATGKGNYTGVIEFPFTILGDITYLDYVDGNWVESTCSNYKLLYDQSALNSQTTFSNGWWVVAEDVTITNRVIDNNEVNLILMDGVTAHFEKGITVNNYNTTSKFTLYAQSAGEGMGKLIIDATNNYYAGIGGSNSRMCGIVTINGGDLNIKGGLNSAAIGSSEASGTNNGVVTINGGHLNLIGGEYAAAIGGGYRVSGGNITINGGVINATGGKNSAAIGGGGTIYSNAGQSGTITINGGQVTATAGSDCPTAIGAGYPPKDVMPEDKISLGWTNDDDFITANGNYVCYKMTLTKDFFLKGTTTLATLDNIADTTIVPAIMPEISLAEVLEGENGNCYTIKDDVAVAAVNDDYAIVTDGSDWLKLTSSIEELAEGDIIKNLRGKLAIDEAGNPSFDMFGYEDSQATVDYQVDKFILAWVTEESLISLKSGQLVTLKGYYDETNSALCGKINSPQGVVISMSTSRVGALEDGSHLEVTGVISFKQAWDESGNGAPRRVPRTGDSAYENLTLDAQSVVMADPTGIINILVGGREVLGIYDLRGIEVKNPAKGNIYIIRFADGTAEKVRL